MSLRLMIPNRIFCVNFLISKQQFNEIQIHVGSTEINASLSARNSGVIFDSHLNLESYINTVCRSTFFHYMNIRSVRNMLTDNACSQIVHALFTRL